jgi:hypothetical protein
VNKRMISVTSHVACALVLTGVVAPLALAQEPFTITPETTVKLVLADRLTSNGSHKGDRFTLRVDEDIVGPTGAVLIRKGTAAYGTVTQSRGAGSFGKRGLLNVSIDYTTAVDGQRVPLRGSSAKPGKSGSKAAVYTFAFVSVAGFFIKGGNSSIQPGTTLMAFADETVTVNPAVTGGAGVGVASPTIVAAGYGAPAPMASPGGPQTTLVLHNGDRITGQLESLINGVYTMSTGMGRIQISAANVQAIVDARANQNNGVTTAARRPR